jgi:hypothetical protein
MAVIMMNAVFCDVTLCGSMVQLLVTANALKSLILSTLIMRAIRSSETSVLTRATRRHIPEDGIPHSHSLQNLKSCLALTGCAL